MAFVPLFCQSHFSPLGVSSCAELARRARALGYSTLGISDEATIAGFHEFDEACRAMGIRPVFGCRLRVDGFILGAKHFPLDLLIESEQGYRQLVRLLTRLHRHGTDAPGLRAKLNLKHTVGGLLVIAPRDGELAELVGSHDRQRTEQCLKAHLDYFGPALAIGLDPCMGPRGLDSMLSRLANFAGVPAVAAPRYCYAEPAEAPALIFLENPEGAPDRGFQPSENLKTLPALFAESDVLARFGAEEESVHRSGDLARRCAWRPASGRRLVPTQDFDRGFDANSHLFELAIRGATERYGEIREEIKQRINREFEEIKSRDLATYLLFHHRIAEFLDEQGILRGVGRGSAVASVIAYCLGITGIDPIGYRLAPQPLAAENQSLPPICIEIPSGAVAQTLRWLKDSFGSDHLAALGRRLLPRRDQLIDELASWATMTTEERDLSHREKSRGRGGAAELLRQEAEDRRPRRWRDPAFVVELAARLASRPRPPQPSPGRWIVSADPLDSVVPLRPVDSGEVVTDLCEAAVDRLGVPRLEFLPHHLLNLLDRARLSVRESEPDFRVSEIPLDDRATFELLGRGETIGIAPLDGITVKSLLRREKPTTLLQLLRIKTEAAQGRTAQVTRDLIDELPDVLLSYQCAYFKANQSAAYFAGALSSMAENGDEVAVAVRAAADAGIEILAPDINLSGAACTVHAGKIRLGLRMVRRLGEKAWEEIQRARLGGRLHSLKEICGAVSPRTINLRLLQNLIGAGAFDGFGQSRAEMSALVARLQRKGRGAAPESTAPPDPEHTLFDMSALEEDKPAREEIGPLPDADWDRATICRREKEALGFSLASDVALCFPNVMESLHPLAPGDVTARLNRRQIRTAGLVDHVESEGPLVGEQGARLVDLEGLAVWLDPSVARLSRRALTPGAEVLAIGVVGLGEGYLRLEVQGLWRMEDLEEQAKRVAVIRLNLEGENRATLKHLTALSREYRGSSLVEPLGFSNPRGWSHRVLSRQRVFFCSPFYQGLCKILPLERVELFDHKGRELTIALSDSPIGVNGPK